MKTPNHLLARLTVALLLVTGAGTLVADELKDQAAAALATQDFESAARLYQELIRQSPEDGSTHYRLAIVLMSLSDLEASETHFKKAGELGFQPLGVGYRLARIRVQQGRTAEALETLEQIAKQGFSIPALLEKESDFDSLRDQPRFVAVLETIRASRYPCKANSHNRAFDFWVGDWDVSYQGATAGRNEIKTILGDCVLFENWTSAQGSTGKSFNFYDAAEDHWRQIWIDDRGGVIEFTGQFEQGVLRYKATTNIATGGKTLHQLNFSANPDGSVRQHWLTSNDDGQSWQEAFDGHYVRREQ